MATANYLEVTFHTADTAKQEILVALLTAEGWEGFEQREDGLVAFIPSELADEQRLRELAGELEVGYNSTTVGQRNWNEEWESGFEPVQVDDFAVVRAAFHAAVGNVKHELVITPRMSFGTGHHATTYLMIRNMQGLTLDGARVLDFGTGTGVLAILAEKCGAATVVAIDNDEWSMANAADNLRENNCSRIQLVQADHAGGQGHFNVILANINRNVILDNLDVLASSLYPGGELLLSGLLPDDEQVIRDAMPGMLVFAAREERNNWLCLRFLRQR